MSTVTVGLYLVNVSREDLVELSEMFDISDNCNTGMGESQYSYQGLPDPESYFSGNTAAVSPNIFICENNPETGLATPNTRARRVVHEVIV